MKSKLLASRYALALLRTAKARGELETVKADLQSIAGLFREEPDLRRFLENPGIGDDQKHALVDATLKGRLSFTCFDFIHLLLDRYRIDHAEMIMEAFTTAYEEDQGIQKIRITTASPMDEDLRRSLIEQLKLLSPKRVLLDHHVDPQILGGMKIQLNDQIFDGSLSKKLNDLRDALAGVKV